MSEPRFRYLNSAQRVVIREWPDGRQESCSVEAPEYLAWLADGNNPDPVDLSSAKAAKLAEIEAAFQARVEAGMPYGEKLLQIRDEDRGNITAVFSRAMAYLGQQAAPVLGVTITWPEGGYPWRMLDDTYVLLSPTAFIAMAQQAADHYGALFYISRAMKDAATAATSLEEIAAIDVDSGWS